MKHRVGQLEKFFLQLLIFTIPINLFYRFDIPQAYVRGRLVDYLIPKLYLSDIIIIIILSLGVIRCITLIHKMYSLPKSSSDSIFNFLTNYISLSIQKLPSYSTLILFLTYLLVISISSIVPISGLYLWITLLKMLILFKYLHLTYSLTQFLSVVKPAIQFTLLFQFFLSTYQFVTQRSLLPYAFLGEVSFDNPGIVSTNFFEQLFHPPYGTTPHPNVLAGMFTIFTLTLISIPIYNPYSRINKVTNYIYICLLIIISVLTQSLSAFLTTLTMLIIMSAIISMKRFMLVCLVVTSTLLIYLVLIPLIYHSVSLIDMYSIVRRYMLFEVSFDLLKSSLLSGTGLNQFIPSANRYSLFTDPGIYLEPVHNIYLLWLVETGIVGAISLLWIARTNVLLLLKTPQIRFIPLFTMLMIGVFDHYPYTLNTGQLLFLLVTAVAFLPHRDNSQSNGELNLRKL